MDIEGQYKMLAHFDQIITDTPLATSSMTVNSFKHREAWLHAVTERLRPMFASHGAKIPDKIRLTCGFPSVRAFSAKKQCLGQCWADANSADGHCEMMISPVLDDPMRVAGVLAHELVHATVGNQHGHKGPFAKLARAIGLEGKMTATTEGEAFKQALKPILQAVGPYPHAELSKKARTRQGTRLLKLHCPICTYTVRITRKWLDEVGPPACPTHGDDLKEVSSTTSKGSMNTEIAHLIGAILDTSDADKRDLRRNVLLDYIVGRVNWFDYLERILNERSDKYEMPKGTPSKLLGDNVVVRIVEELREEILKGPIEEQLEKTIDAPKGTKERATCQNILQRSIVLLIHHLNNEGKDQTKS